MHKDFILIGASGHAKVIIEIIEAMNGRIKAISDKNPDIAELLGYPVHTDAPGEGQWILAIGSNNIRKRLAENMGATYGTAIHPNANISPRCEIGEGTVVMAGVSINSSVIIGRHCIINTNASIDHDCRIDDYAHISPNAALAGNVTVGEGAQVGIGASVIQGIHVGKWAVIGAGAAIIQDVPDYAVVAGVPGKIIKYSDTREI